MSIDSDSRRLAGEDDGTWVMDETQLSRKKVFFFPIDLQFCIGMLSHGSF